MLAFATADEFVDHVLTSFFTDVHTTQDNNYDWGRFSYDGVDRSHESYTDLHIATFKALLRHSDDLFAAWRLLADETSKALFIDLLRYRLAGHRHVKLAINTQAYWDKLQEAARTVTTPSAIGLQSAFGPLWHYEFPFDDKPLKIDSGVPWPLFLRQYYYARDGLSIGPQAGDHIVDAGAGVGDTALAFGCSAGPSGMIYSFELLESHLKAYAYNIAQNEGLSRFKVFPSGLSDKVFTPSTQHADATKYDPGFSLSSDNQDYPTTTLDHLVQQNEIERVDFIKMDIEGSELRALHGATETLKRFKPRLAISLYHDIAHFYEVPLFLHKLGLGYRFHLDHYTIHAGETVLYATTQ